MATAIQGLNQAFMRSISALGSDVFYIEKFPWEGHDHWWKIRNRRDFSLTDALIIATESKHVLAISVEASGNCPVKCEHKIAGSGWVDGKIAHSTLVRQLKV